jgi:hypothetical protein
MIEICVLAFIPLVLRKHRWSVLLVARLTKESNSEQLMSLSIKIR